MGSLQGLGILTRMETVSLTLYVNSSSGWSFLDRSHIDRGVSLRPETTSHKELPDALNVTVKLTYVTNCKFMCVYGRSGLAVKKIMIDGFYNTAHYDHLRPVSDYGK